MLNALWGFISPEKQQPEPPPLQRPCKYPRMPAVTSFRQPKESRANERFARPNFAPLPPTETENPPITFLLNKPTTPVLSPLSDAPMDMDPVESNIEAQSEECCSEKRRREETPGDDETSLNISIGEWVKNWVVPPAAERHAG
ncbi:hypothetical protein B0H14DRAFT_2608636 [Mycena olivaceomarginata]|nr:hypothetical protein B0H14DRAFT_2608636 [Mycena olivaceomarginata]